MKKIIGAALILSMLGGSAAFAAPAYGNNRGYSDQRHDNSGAVIAGVGLLALAAIFASQNNHDDYGYRSDYRHDERGWGDHRDYRHDDRGWGDHRDNRGGYDHRGFDGRR
jgi:hypothetical protein